MERFGVPAVLGELMFGAILALICNIFGFLYITGNLLLDVAVITFAQFGVNLLLFQTGLEEDVWAMARIGPRAVIIALIGVVCPGVLGAAVSTLMFPEATLLTHVFVGATLVATSVGMTAKLFADLDYRGYTRTLVIGAAVADDVIGLVLFAVLTGLAAGVSVTVTHVAETAGSAVVFIVASVIVGRIVAPVISNAMSAINPGIGMKSAVALFFCFGFGFLAQKIAGLEPIIGAFCAGLLLDGVHFARFENDRYVCKLEAWASSLDDGQSRLREEMQSVAREARDTHVEHLVEGIGRLFIPVFFVIVGASVDLRVFADLHTLLIALCLTAVAVVGKLVCGLVAGKEADRWVVAWAMVARGEVGLVFALFGKIEGVFSDAVFSTMAAVIVLSTFLPPLVLPRLVRSRRRGDDVGSTVQNTCPGRL